LNVRSNPQTFSNATTLRPLRVPIFLLLLNGAGCSGPHLRFGGSNYEGGLVVFAFKITVCRPSIPIASFVPFCSTWYRDTFCLHVFRTSRRVAKTRSPAEPAQLILKRCTDYGCLTRSRLFQVDHRSPVMPCNCNHIDSAAVPYMRVTLMHPESPPCDYSIFARLRQGSNRRSPTRCDRSAAETRPQSLWLIRNLIASCSFVLM